MNIMKFFDKLEDKIRGALSHHPIIYAFIGSVGIVLLWRGIWMIADDFELSGVASTILGVLLLMAIGLFVSFFIGDQILLSGIKEEKRIDEKTEDEIRGEAVSLRQIKNDIEEIKNHLRKLDKKGKTDKVK
ncbi:MAG: hypothetical protein WC461_00825 [Candidatus Paceibacterota bacterium]